LLILFGCDLLFSTQYNVAYKTQAPHLADTLAQWAHDFEYEKLMALVAPEA
jgi:hypothetical protein